MPLNPVERFERKILNPYVHHLLISHGKEGAGAGQLKLRGFGSITLPKIKVSYQRLKLFNLPKGDAGHIQQRSNSFYLYIIWVRKRIWHLQNQTTTMTLIFPTGGRAGRMVYQKCPLILFISNNIK